jgi:hypothetical protein
MDYDDFTIPVSKQHADMMVLICETLCARFGIDLPLSMTPRDEGIYVSVPGGRVLIAGAAIREFHTADGFCSYLNTIEVQ